VVFLRRFNLVIKISAFCLIVGNNWEIFKLRLEKDKSSPYHAFPLLSCWIKQTNKQTKPKETIIRAGLQKMAQKERKKERKE
jgi:hypothetical protein